MNKVVMMCRSLTYAQSAARTLERGGLTVSVVKIPQSLSQTGCNYGVQLGEHRLQYAVELLRKHGRPFGKVFRYTGDGGLEEVQV